VAVAEMLKLAMFQQLEGDDQRHHGASRALQSAVNAQKASAEARRRLEEDVQARLQKAAEAAQEVGKKAGVSAETLAEINRALGVQ
jgi:hypothetical protein